jgi:hypothetical protein
MVVRVAAGEAGHDEVVAWINRRTHEDTSAVSCPNQRYIL